MIVITILLNFICLGQLWLMYLLYIKISEKEAIKLPTFKKEERGAIIEPDVSIEEVLGITDEKDPNEDLFDQKYQPQQE